jgi:hypothetical protein
MGLIDDQVQLSNRVIVGVGLAFVVFVVLRLYHVPRVVQIATASQYLHGANGVV